MLKMYVEAKNRLHLLKAYMQDIRGATAIEYGLIAAGIAVAIIVAVFALGDELEAFFNAIQSQLGSKRSEIGG